MGLYLNIDLVKKGRVFLLRAQQDIFRFVGKATQKRPTTSPLSLRSIASAAGTRGRPGAAIMSPVIATIKPAPALQRNSRTFSSKLRGAPSNDGLAEKEYCVLDTQTGNLSQPRATS